MHPSSFRKSLRKFDKELRLLWSGKKGQWEIWHKDIKGKKYLVMPVPIGTLGPEIIRRLWELTPLKQGGAKKVNKILNKMSDEAEAREDKDLSEKLDSLESEAYNSLKIRTGERVHMNGFTVSDSRRFKPEKALSSV